MTGYTTEELWYRMEDEGIDYTFRFAIDSNKVEDEEIKNLALQYVNLGNKLEKLIEEKVTTESLEEFSDELWFEEETW